MTTAREKVERVIAAGVDVKPRPAKSNGAAKPAKVDPLASILRCEMSTEQVAKLADQKFVEPGLIVHGHVIVIPAPPNAGKTTIVFFNLAPQWTTQYIVLYVDADSNPSDVKRMHAHAMKHGIRYITPDYIEGGSAEKTLRDLEALAKSDADLGFHVLVIDTLKKFANVIHKAGMRTLMKLFRKLSSKGMTVILLAHTNKYRDAEGSLIFEGVQDLKSDCDEMIYFEPRENPDGSLTVSSRRDKTRALIERFTWTIHRDRTITRENEYVDVLAESRQAAMRERDEPVIEAISEALSNGAKKQVELIEHCRQFRQTEKRVRAVLREYSGELWRAEKLFERNAWRYELLPVGTTNSRTPLPDCRTAEHTVNA
jgi:KaiC/GvpD/RAD55 family RecA-like ATPase